MTNLNEEIQALVDAAMNKIDNDPDYVKAYMERTKRHIELVNKYASKIGKSYPQHDLDKFQEHLEGYSLWSKPDKTPDETDKLNAATRAHIANNQHHPEYWSDVDLTKFSRNVPTICEAYGMPLDAITEMCCDWCAMSEELGNSPFEWAEKQIGHRWFFNEEQIMHIYDTLKNLWGDTDAFEE